MFSQDFKEWWLSTSLALIFASTPEVHSYVDYEDKLRELFSQENRKLSGILRGTFQYLKWVCMRAGKGLFKGHVMTKRGFEWL